MDPFTVVLGMAMFAVVCAVAAERWAAGYGGGPALRNGRAEKRVREEHAMDAEYEHKCGMGGW